MALTSRQIQGDIYRMLRNSPISKIISGSVYRGGMRPRDSQKEDAVVYFIAGLADEIETGVVSILVFVPDINLGKTGVYIEDSARTEEIEKAAQQWVDGLTTANSCYKFSLDQTITTSEEPDIRQHTVDIRLRYKYYCREV